MRFATAHRLFTLRPRLCRWPGRGWSLWWLWFEVAFIRESRRENIGANGQLVELLEWDEARKIEQARAGCVGGTF